MKRLLQFILVLLLIAIVAIFTIPSDALCKEKASKKLEAYLINKVRPEYAMGESLIRLAIKSGVSVEDKILYKEITFSFRGEKRTIGYGLFGWVKMKELNYYEN